MCIVKMSDSTQLLLKKLVVFDQFNEIPDIIRLDYIKKYRHNTSRQANTILNPGDCCERTMKFYLINVTNLR